MFIDALTGLWESSGFVALTWQHVVMILLLAY